MLPDMPKIILCAEDDPDDKEMFCQAVEEFDPELRVIHSDNGKQLIDKLKELTSINIVPCLITVDINMPVMGGREAVEIIRSNDEWKNIPIAVYTTSPHMMNTDLEAKYHLSIFRKPDSFPAIKNTVAKVMSLCKS